MPVLGNLPFRPIQRFVASGNVPGKLPGNLPFLPIPKNSRYFAFPGITGNGKDWACLVQPVR